MQKLMPQEVEVWYLLPSLRRELAKILIKDYSLTQKEVAKIFGLTESAVSQYVKLKRANDLKFSKKELDSIKKYASKINKSPEKYQKYLFQLSLEMRGTESMCKLHKKFDPSLKKGCDLCRK